MPTTTTGANNPFTNIVTAMSTTDPAAAAALVDNLPPGGGYDRAITAIAQNWMSHDPQAASQWIQGLQSTSLDKSGLDNAVRVIVQTQAENDPSTAYNWATTINNANMRNNQISNVLAAWAQTDPQAAMAAAQDAPVTDAQRKTIVNRINQAAAGNAMGPNTVSISDGVATFANGTVIYLNQPGN
jgi:hypothetical protein